MAKARDQRRRRSAGGQSRSKSPGQPSRLSNQARLRQRQQFEPSGPGRWAKWASEGPVGNFAAKAGVPAWALVLGAAAWLAMLLVWAAGGTKWSFVIFLGAVLSATIATGAVIASMVRTKDPLRGARAGVLVVLATFVPVIFDPHTGDVFNLPKYTLVVLGSLVLAAVWAVAAVHHRRLPRWRNGLQWLVAALIVWAAVCAFAGVDTHVSLLGNYGSYDGLYAAAAFAVVIMVSADAFDGVDALKVLSAWGLGGGSAIVVYGLVQLHDTEVHGHTWDFINWHTTSFAGNIFSTFGNPNHLGGYLAMALPIAIVVGLWATRWYWRAAAGLFTLALLIELLRTSARGAWLAAVVAMVVLAVFTAPELKRYPRAALAGTVGVVLVAAVGMAAGGKRFLSHPLSTLFQSGGSSSVEQRLQIWRAAVRVAVDHPIFGIGPDTFALVYPRYQSAAWVKALGPSYLVNGAHDIFMNTLADQGFIGIALFVALLGAVALRSAGAWRRFRLVEREESAAGPAAELARRQRVALAVVCASIAAYLVQAAFNVQQIGLTFSFWLFVGLAAVLSREAGVPDTLRPGSLLSLQRGSGAPERPAERERPSYTGAIRWGQRRAGRGSATSSISWATWSTAVVSVAVVVLVGLGAGSAYRADHLYWAANTAPSTQQAAFFDDIHHAVTLNPWEPTYPFDEGIAWANASGHASSSAEEISDLNQARTLFAQATADKPLWSQYAANEAEAYGELAHLQPAQAKTDLSAALSLALQALHNDPRDPQYTSLVHQVRSDIASGRTKPAG